MVRLCPPCYGKPVEVWLDLAEYEAACFQPLPPDRELYDAPIFCAAFSDDQRTDARKQLYDRAKLANYIGPKIAHALCDAVTKQDTINGYSPEEYHA